MATLNMFGPYPLNESEINNIIHPNSIGNYAYGVIGQDGSFYVRYVGRSDTDLQTRIKHGIGQYPFFKYSYADSPEDAFRKECQNYHDFGEKQLLDNERHPDKPNGIDNLNCPVCGNE